MSTFTGYSGQTLFDVCSNTYGSLDYMMKMIQDSGVDNVDATVYSGQKFVWDSSLVVDQQVLRATTLSGKVFATASSGNSNTYYIVVGQGEAIPTESEYLPIIKPSGVSTYQRTSATSYTALSDGETTINLPELIGKDILQIELEIKPLKSSEFTWNKLTGVLTLAPSVVPLYADQTLYILYTEIVTS